MLQSGLLDRLASGAVICIASSVSPDLCRELEAAAARKGIGMLDTPVVLGQEAANSGTLSRSVPWLSPASPMSAERRSTT